MEIVPTGSLGGRASRLTLRFAPFWRGLQVAVSQGLRAGNRLETPGNRLGTAGSRLEIVRRRLVGLGFRLERAARRRQCVGHRLRDDGRRLQVVRRGLVGAGRRSGDAKVRPMDWVKPGIRG